MADIVQLPVVNLTWPLVGLGATVIFAFGGFYKLVTKAMADNSKKLDEIKQDIQSVRDEACEDREKSSAERAKVWERLDDIKDTQAKAATSQAETAAHLAGFIQIENERHRGLDESLIDLKGGDSRLSRDVMDLRLTVAEAKGAADALMGRNLHQKMRRAGDSV